MCQRLVASGLVYLNLPIAYSPGLQGKLGNVVLFVLQFTFQYQSQSRGWWHPPPQGTPWGAVLPGFAAPRPGVAQGLPLKGLSPKSS